NWRKVQRGHPFGSKSSSLWSGALPKRPRTAAPDPHSRRLTSRVSAEQISPLIPGVSIDSQGGRRPSARTTATDSTCRDLPAVRPGSFPCRPPFPSHTDRPREKNLPPRHTCRHPLNRRVEGDGPTGSPEAASKSAGEREVRLRPLV